jgi:hypothetical protein
MRFKKGLFTDFDFGAATDWMLPGADDISNTT